MIIIKCRRFEQDGSERGGAIGHQKKPEDALGFLIEVDLNFGASITLVSENHITTRANMLGLIDITDYTGTKEDMVSLHKAAELYEFVKTTKRETNKIAYDKAIKRLAGGPPPGKERIDFMEYMSQIFAGTAAARITCMLLIGAGDAYASNVDYSKMKIEELIAMAQLVLFHDAKVSDLI